MGSQKTATLPVSKLSKRRGLGLLQKANVTVMGAIDLGLAELLVPLTAVCFEGSRLPAKPDSITV